MQYISTRGRAAILDFDHVLLEGLASDGGLYVPEVWPILTGYSVPDSRVEPYEDLVLKIIRPFIGESRILTEPVLRSIIHESYASFSHPQIAPLSTIGDNLHILELYHGPTLAFKDFALQVLGRLMDHLLLVQNRRLTIIGATSGDTGSAAIAACKNRSSMRVFILHPKGRTSEVQRRQMTTVDADNVFNIAVEGTFDDCQALVKALFNDPDFRVQHALGAINSINWARVLLQVPYYFHAARQLAQTHSDAKDPIPSLSFCVPTGNFGDVFAGYVANQMGLTIRDLIVATNQNDILTRFFKTGIYQKDQVQPTQSPSMDIQVASNFERFLFDIAERKGDQVASMMKIFEATGCLNLEQAAHVRARHHFSAHKTDEEATTSTMRYVFETDGVLLDPHTAVAVHAAQSMRGDPDTPMVILSTAHPAKFPDSVYAATGCRPDLPPHMNDLFDLEERYITLPNDRAALKAYIAMKNG